MKKKAFFAVVLFISVILEMSIVYADVIVPGQIFNEYNNNEKIGSFLEILGSPLKEIITVVTICTFILAMVIVNFYLIEDKNSSKSNNSMNILKKMYLGISFVLNMLQIQILRCSLIFNSNFTGVRTMSAMREDKINYIITPIFYIIYIIIMISLSIFGKKKKKEKVIYIATTITTILLFIICIFIVYNTPAGYYTYDNEFQEFLGL